MSHSKFRDISNSKFMTLKITYTTCQHTERCADLPQVSPTLNILSCPRPKVKESYTLRVTVLEGVQIYHRLLLH